MMLEETCLEHGKRPLIQIFATDLDREMIKTARLGNYPISALHEIPDRFHETYLVGIDDRFEIHKKIREMVRFSVHDLIQDPPFSKIDLISCRNLMIYLSDTLQVQVFPLLHFSLREGGHLFLGNSESASRAGDLFFELDQASRIYRRNPNAKRGSLNLPLSLTSQKRSASRIGRRMAEELDFPRHSSFDSSNKAVFERYGPPFIRLASDGRIVDSSGDLALFLKSIPGAESRLDQLAREGLAEVAWALVADAFASTSRRALKDVDVTSPFGTQQVDIIADPMGDDTVLLIFNLKQRLKPIVDEYAIDPPSQDERFHAIQDENRLLRRQIKEKVEEIETANEELKSSNEEMMSMNEELQSSNEELTTANEELKNKIDELKFANSDLDNLLQSPDLALVVLDRHMRIRHLSEAARKLLPLMRKDEGRLISEFDLRLGNLPLERRVREVIETGIAAYETVDSEGWDQSYLLRITPYVFAGGKVDGVTLSFVDITKEVELRRELAIETKKLRLAMRSSKVGSWDSDLENKTAEIDEVAADLFGLKGAGVYAEAVLLQHVREADRDINAELKSVNIPSGNGYEQIVALAPPGGVACRLKISAAPYIAHDGRKMVAGVCFELPDVAGGQSASEGDPDNHRLAMQGANMGLATLDLDAGHADIDEIFASQLELDSSGRVSIVELTANFVAKDGSLIEEKLAAVRENGEPSMIDFRVKVKGKKQKRLRANIVALASDGEKGRALLGPSIEVTDT